MRAGVTLEFAAPIDPPLGKMTASGLEASDRPLLTVMSENYGYHFDDHRAQIKALGRAGGRSMERLRDERA